MTPPTPTPDLWADLVRAVRAFALAMYGDEPTTISIRFQHLHKAVYPLPPPCMFNDNDQPSAQPDSPK